MVKGNEELIGSLDLNEAALQCYRGNSPELRLEGGRVTFYYRNNEKFRRISADYRNNVKVAILDFVQAQRVLKSQVWALRDKAERSR